MCFICVWILDVHSETGVRVPENARQGLWIDSAVRCVSGEGMPEVVESHHGKLDFFENGFELFISRAGMQGVRWIRIMWENPFADRIRLLCLLGGALPRLEAW